MAIKILHADRFTLYNEGLKALFNEEEKGYTLIGYCKTVEEMLFSISQYEPELLITDTTLLPDISVLPKICSYRDAINPTMKIIILTMDSRLETIKTAFELGVDGYLFKYSSSAEITNCISEVTVGRRNFPLLTNY